MANHPPIDGPGATDSGEADERIGQLFGEYRVTSRIGKGGMGAVYAVEHERLGRVAAIKVIHSELLADPKLIQRFGVEALTVARLQHPNIVDVYDVRDTPEPHCVMELLRGRSLANVLAAEGALPEERVLYIAQQVLGVLDVVHQRGIVHRDIKPDNIFLVDDGVRSDHVKLLDFGVAKILDGLPVGLTSTGAGAMLGTPLYMSPEQIEAGTIDARTDLYAFGLVMYEMVTGRPPLSAASLTALLSKQLLEMPPPPRSQGYPISEKLETAIMRSIAKKPEDRFASAEEVLRALGLGGSQKAVSSPGAPREARVHSAVGVASTLGRASGEVIHEVHEITDRARRRRREIQVAAIGLGLGLAALVAFAVGKGGSPHKEEAPPAKPAIPATQPPSHTAADALAQSAALFANGDGPGAIRAAREAIAAGATHDGWLVVARIACTTHATADLEDAVKHLSKADAARVTADCAPAHKAPAKGKKPRATDDTVAPPHGAPIIDD
jgi:serine/threonine-protein kinase